jgi:iron complex transport system substrate-binding protein
MTPFRGFAAAAIATALVLTGCASTPAETETETPAGDTFPVTIEHAFGETTIDAAPERVVAWGWGSADAAIALGVVPVAIPFQAYGGDENGVLPWIADALDELGAETPTVLPDSSEEPPYEDIAAADPDVILAAYSGITEEQYETLSAIAPVVAYPETAWSTPWKDLVDIVGTALGKSSEADAVLADIDTELAAQAEAHPEFAGKTIAAVWDVGGTFYVYRDADPRVEFLFDLGFVNAPAVDELANGESTFYYTLSYEELDKLEADVVVSYSDTQAEADTFVASSHGQTIPAVAAGNVATLVGTEFIASVSPPTALSLPWGLDQFVTALAAATAE